MSFQAWPVDQATSMESTSLSDSSSESSQGSVVNLVNPLKKPLYYVVCQTMLDLKFSLFSSILDFHMRWWACWMTIIFAIITTVCKSRFECQWSKWPIQNVKIISIYHENIYCFGWTGVIIIKENVLIWEISPRNVLNQKHRSTVKQKFSFIEQFHYFPYSSKQSVT